MKNRLFSGLLCGVAGLLLIAVPVYILPVCKAVTPPYMKCFWTMRVEIGLGCALLFLGLMLAMSRNPAVRVGLSLGGLCLAALAVATPTVMVGVCGMDTMSCRMGTLPALVLTGSVLLAGLLLNVAWLLSMFKVKRY